MAEVTKVIEDGFRQFASDMSWVMNEAKDIEKAYFATDASTLVSALALDTDGASNATKLTKAQYVNAIGFIQQLKNFFDNSAVTQGDYLTNIQQVKYGNAAVPATLSAATEDVANRLKVLCDACLTHFLTAKDLKDLYDNSELSVLVAGLSAGRKIYGANMNNSELTTGITLVEQYKKMINNEAVTQGLYSATIAIWELVEE